MTAVQWLYEQIDNKDMGEIPMWVYDFCNQALEMEKEQILKAQQVQKGDYCAVCGCREFWNDKEEE